MIGKLVKVIAGIGAGVVGISGLAFSAIAIISLIFSAIGNDSAMMGTNIGLFLGGATVGIVGLVSAIKLIFR